MQCLRGELHEVIDTRFVYYVLARRKKPWPRVFKAVVTSCRLFFCNKLQEINSIIEMFTVCFMCHVAASAGEKRQAALKLCRAKYLLLRCGASRGDSIAPSLQQLAAKGVRSFRSFCAEQIKLLIAAGADVDACDAKGRSAMYFAAVFATVLHVLMRLLPSRFCLLLSVCVVPFVILMPPRPPIVFHDGTMRLPLLIPPIPQPSPPPLQPMNCRLLRLEYVIEMLMAAAADVTIDPTARSPASGLVASCCCLRLCCHLATTILF